jgi:hypothetical protein
MQDILPTLVILLDWIYLVSEKIKKWHFIRNISGVKATVF